MTRPAGRSPRARATDGVFAALDLGTNNCRMLAASPAADGFRVIDSFSRIVRLGEGLHATGRIGDAAADRTIEALHACAARLGRHPVQHLRAVATEACRQASNGLQVLERIRRETGFNFTVISAREEALLALESCAPLFAATARRALLFDIGGGSTELAWVRLDTPDRHPELIGTATLPLGVITLAERHGSAAFEGDAYDAMVADIRRLLGPFERVHCIAREVLQGGVQLLGTSGTVTTLAGVALKLIRYRRPLVDGMALSAAAAGASIAELRALGPEGMARHPCVGPDRVEFVLPGCAVLQAICETWPMPEVTVADRGLREGMLLQMMNAPSRSPARAAVPA